MASDDQKSNRPASTPFPDYVHRHNWDRSFDSICTRCAATVATSMYENELAEIEKAHVCERSIISNAGTATATSSAKPKPN